MDFGAETCTAHSCVQSATYAIESNGPGAQSAAALRLLQAVDTEPTEFLLVRTLGREQLEDAHSASPDL